MAAVVHVPVLCIGAAGLHHKKLIEAAQFSLMPPSDRSAHEAQLRQMGVSGDGLAHALEALPPEEFQVFPETLEALELFQICATQWRMRSVPIGMGASMSRPFGLDYTACEAIVRIRGMIVPAETWQNLQTIEKAIVENGNAGG